MGTHSIKAGETNGSASDETPGVYDQDGKVPGTVAPDGRTVISAGIHDADAGRFWVSAIVGDPPEHLFTRLYAVEPPLETLEFSAADGRGTIYVIANALTLVCIDGKTGDPLGRIELPKDVGAESGTPFRRFSVVESGGIVHQHLSNDASTYHWYDCG